MKKKELIIANLAIGVLVLGFTYLTLSLSLNSAPAQVTAAKDSAQKDNKGSEMQNCTNDKAIEIGQINEPHLKRLKDYQDVCNSFVTNTLMVFTGFSANKSEAEANAQEVSQMLKQFHSTGVKPIVIAEPYIKDQAMSYKFYLKGDYDEGMNHFFVKLKEHGINDEMMGTWVPFPESNTPSWNNKDTVPHDYALCVNKYLKKMKEHFPGAKGSLLLNATTYDPNDLNWENGDYIHLGEYVNGVDHNLVDSFGIQGFPWTSNAQQRKRTIFKASEFLQPDFAIGAAQVLRTRDIWLNTGTFASKYTNDPSKKVELSLNERKALLASILEVAKNIREYQQNEYRVTINLFSEDKSDTTEATDWSYFQSFESQTVLKEFLQQTNELEIPISIYDKAKWTLN